MKYNNYIFDLYGTLVDIHTNEKKASVWEKTALALGLQGAVIEPQQLQSEFERKVRSFEKDLAQHESFRIGKRLTEADIEIRLEDVFDEILTQRGMKLDEQQMKTFGIWFRMLTIEKLRLFEQAEPLLQALHANGKKVYLLSNAQRMFTEPEMRYLGIYEMFDGICYSSDVGYKKPSELFYSYLFDKYGLDKEDSVMVGNDWKADAWGAASFGIDSIYIHTEQSSEIKGELPENCMVIDHLMDIVADF